MGYLSLVGQRIRMLRIAAGMSQDALAKKAGYTSRSSINKIELGYTDIPLLKILSLADALSVSPVELLLPVNEDSITDCEALLLESYKNSPDVKALLDRLFYMPDAEEIYSAACSPEDKCRNNRSGVSDKLWEHIAATPESTDTLIKNDQ